jgi:hypothetical protein
MRTLVAIALAMVVVSFTKTGGEYHEEIQCVTADCPAPTPDPAPTPETCPPPRQLVGGRCVAGIWVGQRARDRSR